MHAIFACRQGVRLGAQEAVRCHWVVRNVALGFLLLCSVGTAQPTESPSTRRPHGETDRARGEFRTPAPRKNLTIFSRRPAKDTPEAQLAYAQEQERKGRWKIAEVEYLALVRKWPESPQAAQAQFSYARLREARHAYEDAFEEYQYLMDYYPGRFPYNQLVESQYRIVKAILHRRVWRLGGILPGVRTPEDALPFLQRLLASAPTWERAPEVWLDLGAVHEEREDRDAAIHAYEQIEIRYPDSPHREAAAFRRACCLTAESDAYPRDEGRCHQALLALGAFLAAYPKSAYAVEAEQLRKAMETRLSKLRYEQARFYDTVARRLPAALFAYRQFLEEFPHSPYTPRVRDRLEALTKALAQSP